MSKKHKQVANLSILWVLIQSNCLHRESLLYGIYISKKVISLDLFSFTRDGQN